MSGGKPPAGKGVVGLLSRHGSHFSVCNFVLHFVRGVMVTVSPNQIIILSRLMEKTIVRNFFYPILHNPLFSSLFADQFAFRPTGSTTCALIKLTHELTNMLVDYPYVHVISLDFSKAFDTVRHSSLVQKIKCLSCPHCWYPES